MTIDEFLKSDKNLAIRTKSREQANMLCFALKKNDTAYSCKGKYWNTHKTKTCYDNRGSSGSKARYKDLKFNIIPFADIVFKKDSFQNGFIILDVDWVSNFIKLTFEKNKIAGINFSAKQSLTTNTIYVTFKYIESSLYIRLADHATKKENIKTIFNTENKQKFEFELLKICKNLKEQQLRKSFKRIKKDYEKHNK